LIFSSRAAVSFPLINTDLYLKSDTEPMSRRPSTAW